MALRHSLEGMAVREIGDKDPVLLEKGQYETYNTDKLPVDDEGNEASYPTEEEKQTLRKVAGKSPAVAYWICAVEFAERASYYGVQGLFTNFINKKLPKDGNGLGAPLRGTQSTAGALGKGETTANAITQSFKMLVYALPVLFGWLADTKTGRWSLIWWGVIVCAVAHILMVASGAPSLLASHQSIIPFMMSVYLLAIGAAMFKPNISPTLLDQMPLTVPVAKTLETGEKVVIDPEATTGRVMLWFYWLINLGALFAIPTSYTAKYVGWWPSFFIPTTLYLALLPLLWVLKKRLILNPPGGSDLADVMRILLICFKRGGLFKLFRGDFFAAAKPSVIAQSSHPIHVTWTDGFVEDVRHAFQATGIFCFFPIQMINDNGLGESANFLSNMFTTNGVPNDVINNFNTLIIVVAIPFMNYGFYPFLRKHRIRYGPVAQITTGFLIAALGGAGYAILTYYGYKTSPCGHTASNCTDDAGQQRVSSISIWWMGIPYALGGLSEIFVNVPAYGIAYSRAPKNMRGLVSALNLFSSAVTYAIGLILSSIVRDPYLIWIFAVPAILGVISAGVFWWLYHELDYEDFNLISADEQEEKEGPTRY